MTATTELPDLGLVAFRLDDESDHLRGGHCVSLAQTESAGTRKLVSQYLTAFEHIADRAAESLDGCWAITGSGLDTRVEAVEADRCRRFGALIADLAGNSIGPRYAYPNQGHTPSTTSGPEELRAHTGQSLKRCGSRVVQGGHGSVRAQEPVRAWP